MKDYIEFAIQIVLATILALTVGVVCYVAGSAVGIGKKGFYTGYNFFK